MAIQGIKWKSGVFVALAVALIAFVALASRRWVCSLPWSHDCVAQLGNNIEAGILFLWVKDWEAMFTGMLALAAALLALWVSQANQRQKDRQLLLAARSTLAHALGDLSVHLRDASDYLRTLYDARVGNEIPKSLKTIVPPEIPWASVEALTRLIAVTDVSNGRIVSDLLNAVQVHSANIRDIPRDLSDPHLIYGTWNVLDNLVRTVETDARLASLYEFARFKSEKIEDSRTRTRILNSFGTLGFDDADYAELFQRLDERYP